MAHNSSIDPVKLTPREQEVYDLLIQGCSNKDIEDALHITHATVKYHVSNVLTKFHVKRRTQLIALHFSEGGNNGTGGAET